MSIKLKDTIYDLINNADKIDGIDSTSLFRKLGSNVDINTFADSSNKNGIIYINTTTPSSINAPFSYGTILSFNSEAGSWMLGNSSNGILKFRNRWWSGNGAAWSDWKDIAFLDSNVESASKLATARTITLTGAITGSGSFDGSTNLSIATSVNHTHNYAGSSSPGGSATSAVKLDTTTAGSATQPVYFSGGKPVACTAYSSASVSYATNSGNADTVDSWHKNYFFIGYNGSRHYHLRFGEGQEDLAWKTIVKGSTSIITAPSSDRYIAMTIRGTIWYCGGNHGQMQTKMYPFCAVFQCVGAKTIVNAAYLWLPPFAKSIDCIRIVRISTNNFELQVRQVESWQNGWIDYQILNSGMTVDAYEDLQTAGSGTVVKTAENSSTLSEGAVPSHTHNYASTVKVGSTSYTSSSNVVSLPAYPTVPTSLKCPASLTIQLNGTSQGAWDGSSAKTINITYSNVGAAASSHTHDDYAASSHTHNYAGSNTSAGKAYDLYGHTGNPGSHNNVGVRWYTMASTVSGSTGYAGNNYGFPVNNNANGMLWLGNHTGPYGGQLGISSNGRLYYRFISNGTFPSTANGGSWNKIAWTSDLSSYVTVSGTQTISGKKTFSGGAAITSASENTSMPFFLGIDAFADGGTIKYISKESVRSCIGAAASSHTHDYAATSHTHGTYHSSFVVTLSNTTTDSGWSMINSSYNAGFLLKSIRTSASAPAWIEGNYAAGICFGGADTKGVVSCAYNAPYIKFAGGNGTKPVWWIRVSGTSGTTYNFNNMPYATSAGNADTCDSHHFSTVSSLPSSPNANTVYFIV